MEKITDKIKKVISPTHQQQVEAFRKKNIPKKYNQIELVDHLLDDNIDHYISISNRTDGKTINYLHYFIDYAIRTGVGFTLIARHYTVRFSYQKVIQEIIDTINTKYDPKRFHFIRNDFYILVGYEDKELGLITDLNQATDLKYLSNYLKHFPIMIYDEFLALESDYLPDEWERIKTIYSSINRKEDIPEIKIPKIFYLGNAVNFSSPILANLDIFNKLENQEINTVQIYDNIAIEMRKNEEANERRNLRAFNEENDSMTQGQFDINNHNIVNKNYLSMINKNKNKIVVKTLLGYLVIYYNRDNYYLYLVATPYQPNYDFNVAIKDNKESSVYLDDSFYDPEHYLKYNKDIYKFYNQYSKDYVLDYESNLSNLKLYKLIQLVESSKADTEIKENQLEDTYIEDSKKALFKKFF